MSRDPPDLVTLHTAEEVRRRIDELARELARDHARQRVVMIVIEQGARRFAEALAERVTTEVQLEQRSLRARRTTGTSLGEVHLEDADLGALHDATVWVVDDIVDEGRTLDAVLARVRAEGPRTIRTIVLVRRMTPTTSYPVDLYGFPVTDGWVVGFGMDLDGRLRDLDHLALYHPPPTDA